MDNIVINNSSSLFNISTNDDTNAKYINVFVIILFIYLNKIIKYYHIRVRFYIKDQQLIQL